MLPICFSLFFIFFVCRGLYRTNRGTNNQIIYRWLYRTNRGTNN